MTVSNEILFNSILPDDEKAFFTMFSPSQNSDLLFARNKKLDLITIYRIEKNKYGETILKKL